MVDQSQHTPPYQQTPREALSSELLEHGHIGVRTYAVVFIALMILLVITVAAAQIPFAEHGVGRLGIVITFLIAAVKAVLVVVYFMHIRYSTKLTKVFVVAGLLWLGILFVLTLSDYLTRGWLPLSDGWNQRIAIPRPPAPDPVPEPADLTSAP
jgi:cytochrome c oxidase subunit 4